jgi:hypothetical protein
VHDEPTEQEKDLKLRRAQYFSLWEQRNSKFNYMCRAVRREKWQGKKEMKFCKTVAVPDDGGSMF